MKKLALALTAATFALGMAGLTASAQTQQPGAASLQAQIHNATPIVIQAACHGAGRHCGPGFTQKCGFLHHPHCRCVRCM